MSNINLRKEKEKVFYEHHINTFNAIGIIDPMFVIKTAFFKKGKFGRQSQFFEWELKKGQDIYVEFYDNVYDDNGIIVNILPMNEDRQLFKLKYNPYFYEEYDIIENYDLDGKVDKKFILPINEMMVVLSSGQEISYSLYEKRKEESKNDLPQLQKSLSLFPDFEEDFLKKEEAVKLVGSDFDIDKDKNDLKDEISKLNFEIKKLTEVITNYLNKLQ